MDTITEFVNSERIAYPDLFSGVRVASTSEMETAVVKDLVISTNSSRTLNLNIGPTIINSISSSCKLTGYELLGNSSELRLKTNAYPVYFNEFYCGGSNQIYRATFPTIFSSDNFQDVYPGYEPSGHPSLPNGVSFMCFDAVGNFYYALIGANLLYKRIAGINGNQTSYSFAGSGWCYDGARYIYGFSASNQILTFDTVNSAISSVPTSVPISPSLCYASAIDGFVYTRATYNQSTNYLINVKTGLYVNLPGDPSDSGRQHYVGIGKDPSGNYVVWQTNSDKQLLFWWSIGKSLESPSVLSSSSFGLPQNMTYTSQGVVRSVRQNENNHIFHIGSGNEIYMLDINAKYPMRFSVKPFSSPYEGALCSISINKNRVNNDFGYVSIRATGIKTKL